MTITPEQRTYARFAGIVMLAKPVLEIGGDSVTIIARGGASFAETARYATEHLVLWRVCLLSVGLAWIATAVLAFALYVVLAPVNKRLAQLALVLRLGTSFVGGAGLMFRVAQTRLYRASVTEGQFTTEQLRTLASVNQQGANAGAWIAWIFMCAGGVLFFVLFLRSRYLPRALAVLGIVTAALFIPVIPAMFVFPERSNAWKALALPMLLAEVATALWLMIKGLPQATAEAKP